MAITPPKYQVLADWLRRQITEGKLAYGQRCYSENKLCGMFGYSRQTVRQAIGELAMQGYLTRRQGSGTYVAWQPNTGRGAPRSIGVISTYTDNYIFPAIIKGIERVLTQNGCAMQVMLTHNRVENEADALQSMLRAGVDGLIIEPAQSALPSPNLPLYQAFIERHIPVVQFNAALPGLNLPCVALDDKAVGRLATRYLMSLGHKQIAGLFQSCDMQGQLRYAGYLQAHGEAQIPIGSDNLLWFTTEDMPMIFEDGRWALRCIEGCTAAVCYNDQIATDLLYLLASKSIWVPEQFSVIGVDNFALAEYSPPPLTTIDHPKEVLGSTVAENLLRHIEQPDFDPSFSFEPKLVERNSVRRRG